MVWIMDYGLWGLETKSLHTNLGNPKMYGLVESTGYVGCGLWESWLYLTSWPGTYVYFAGLFWCCVHSCCPWAVSHRIWCHWQHWHGPMLKFLLYMWLDLLHFYYVSHAVSHFVSHNVSHIYFIRSSLYQHIPHMVIVLESCCHHYSILLMTSSDTIIVSYCTMITP